MTQSGHPRTIRKRIESMSERELRLERDTKSRPKCPHCKKEIDTILYRELHGGFWGRRYIYFCPTCQATLSVSHRKGFWMG